MIDSHVHVWDLSRRETLIATQQYPELAGKEFLPADLERMLIDTGARSAVLVHGPATTAHTDFCLQLAHSHTFILSVIGWLDIRGEAPLVELARLQRDAAFRGVRLTPLLDDDPAGYLDCAAVTDVAHALADGAGVVEVLATPAQLPHVLALCERAPATDVVLAHFGLPEMSQGYRPWSRLMSKLAKCDRVHVKLAGLPVAGGSVEQRERMRPFVDLLLDRFGPERLLYGSNWPVMTAVTTPCTWRDDLDYLLDRQSNVSRQCIFEDNAVKLYGF